ncbi:hypothetical protein IMCC21906_01851 [Spongiibacter sp. IMCC21906]|uniref:hypothetical protein n=1 Tax=Spongiibacter sp. IMCC21906 TaxID=1620392 RepID=UPI00062DFCBF|nr:hypothetical protein [Spongiibacter sp. IMCC21906]AKH69526.1 hypothetical protein IMCC21906_01851 [Spongiibacter sp. IMCC21906]
MTYCRIGIFLAVSVVSSLSWADKPLNAFRAWPSSASGADATSVPHLFRRINHYAIEKQRIRLWEFRFTEKQAALLKSGSLEVDLEGTGISVKARF